MSLALLLLGGCVHYQAHPIDPALTARELETRSLADPGLQAFVEASAGGPLGTWPPPAWDLTDLTLAAFYFQPDLDLARARWAVAQAAAVTAGERPNPSLVAGAGYDTTTKTPSPWIPFVALDIPIETAGKRGHRRARASFLSEAARLELASTAWQVRSRLRARLVDLWVASDETTLREEQQGLHRDNVRLLTLQWEAGEISAFELIQARLAADASRLALREAERRSAEDRVRLAEAVGVPAEALDGISLSFEDLDAGPTEAALAEARSQALLRRTDLLSALATYAATQAALQLEIAKQYPDVHLGPGYEFDQGDNKWTLGFGLTLPLFNRNRGPIEDVIAELRHRFQAAVPGLEWEFPGILGDLIGDLIWAPQPIEVKLFSTDTAFLKRKAPEVAEELRQIRGVVDVLDGLVYAGPSLSLKVRHADAGRLGFSAADVAAAVSTAMLGQPASSVLEGDRVVAVRVLADRRSVDRMETLRDLPLRAPGGGIVKLSQLADLVETPGQLELRREDLRQDVAVTARLEGRDLGSAMAEIREVLSRDPSLPPGTVEFGGLFQQQEESFRNLMVVLAMAIFLVFTVLLLEFRSFSEPLAIVFGAVLALFGTVLALRLTGTSLNVVSLLGAIIGVGIVAKNGILMLDRVEHLRAEGHSLEDALVSSGRRRLRPVLMTSMAAAFGMLPLAWGIGSGADMLRPLAIAVIGALSTSVLLSLIATPTVYSLLLGRGLDERDGQAPSSQGTAP